MDNKVIAQTLQELADLCEFNEDNPFRIRAFRWASEIADGYPQDLASLKRDDLLKIPGVGKGIADIIEELRNGHEPNELKKLKAKFPEGLFQVMRVQGLGAKRTAALFKHLKIDSLAALKTAAQKGLIEKLDGFGEKVQENILQNLSFAETAVQRILIPEALSKANDLKTFLQGNPAIKNVEWAGSLRRWKETIGDLDFLCTSQNPEKAIGHFLSYPQIDRVLAQGTTKASVVLKHGPQCDFRVVEPSQFGAALLYITGSKEHNVRLRELAQQKGLTLNEYGLFKTSDVKHKKPVASKTEEEIYQRLGLPWIPPELREDRGEIQAGLQNQLPHLIEWKDILGDGHNHTTLSDGKNTPEDMILAAQAKGWAWYACGDHSPSLNIAQGLSIEALRKKILLLKTLQDQHKKIRILSGSEVDIHADGTMDYPDTILADIDIVIGSVHSRFNLTEDEMTARICKAMNNPHVDILGHISGRLMNTRPGYHIHYETVLQKAKETGTAIEINGQPDRLELSDVHVKRAIEMGIPLALSTDAHSVGQLDNMILALHVARRGWAEPKHILNTRTSNEIIKWLHR